MKFTTQPFPPLPRPGNLTYAQATAKSRALAILRAAGLEVDASTIVPAMRFQVGDVVLLQFEPYGVTYTYTHDGNRFPGVRVPVSDAEMAEHVRAGRARLVVRNGEVVGR